MAQQPKGYVEPPVPKGYVPPAPAKGDPNYVPPAPLAKPPDPLQPNPLQPVIAMSPLGTALANLVLDGMAKQQPVAEQPPTPMKKQFAFNTDLDGVTTKRRSPYQENT